MKKVTLKKQYNLLLILLVIFVVSCDAIPETPSAPVTDTPNEVAPIGPPATLYNESPMLAQRVITGELPSVDDRLPLEPTIINPVESIGEYGGTWHGVTGINGGADALIGQYEPPIRWNADFTNYEPGLATYDWSEDGKTFTLHFKKEIKWSDGEDFTVADIEFWWEDLVNNPDMENYSVPWFLYMLDGKTPIDMEFPDAYTWVWKSDQPMWITPYILAQGTGTWRSILKPKHFLIDHHPTYNSEAKSNTFEQIDRYDAVPGYPCLFAWCLQEYTEDESWLWARNPYYWKVDTQGNQLPYIDYLHIEFVEERDMRLQNIAQGKYEVSFLGVDDSHDVLILAENADAQNYQLYSGWTNGAGGWPSWLINQNYNGDESTADEIRLLLSNKWFRKGLSLSLDRKRFLDIVWKNLGTHQQATLNQQSWHFASHTGDGPLVYDAWRKVDSNFDVTLAEEYFARASFTDQDGDGWRELPSGEPFELLVDLGPPSQPAVPVFANDLAREYWEAVGIKVAINDQMTEVEWAVRQKEGSFMLRNFLTSELDAWLHPDWIFPINDTHAWPLEGLYYQTDGQKGWEPEFGSAAARLQNLYDGGIQLSDQQSRHEVMWEAIRIHITDGPFVIGVTGQQHMPVVVMNGFHNIPVQSVVGHSVPASPGNVHPEQFWMEASLR